MPLKLYYLRRQIYPLPPRIKVAAVSYLNTKPLLWGIEHSNILDEIELELDYPARLASGLRAGNVDIALLPVAAISEILNARIVGDYGIAADGEVASVALFSKTPLESIETVYLDYQSRTSVQLTRILFKHFWKKEVTFLPAPENYIEMISGTTAGVIIGDRALEQRTNFPFVYDLAEAWKAFTGLPFVFAAWVSNKELPADFLSRFNEANREGLKHIDDVVAANPFPAYDLQKYYRENIQYLLDEPKKAGLERFLELIKE